MDGTGGNAIAMGARLDAPGTRHHVMVRGIERRRIVLDNKDRKNLLDRMGDLVVEMDTVIFGCPLQKSSAN